jgi:mutator protein MutT
VEVVAAVVRREGRWLVARRPAGKRHGGLWEFPGGKLRPGEDRRAAVARELREELGLDLRSLGQTRFSRRDPGASFVIHFVEAEVDGEPVAHEHEGLLWATRPELRSLALAPADRAFVEFVASGGADR